MVRQPNVSELWSDMDWNGSTTASLRQKIKARLKQGIDINKMDKRIANTKSADLVIEDYTLYDLAIQSRLHAQNQNASHWFALMAMLRTMGAKPACLLINQMSQEEKLKNNLATIQFKEKYLEKQKKQYLIQLEKIKQK